MKKLRGFVGILGVAGLIILGTASGNGEAATTPETSSEPAAVVPSGPAGGASVPVSSEAGQEPSVGAPIEPAAVAVAPPAIGAPAQVVRSVAPSFSTGGSGLSALVQAGSGQAGIWVTGEGSLSLAPDLALINIGVETSAATVAEARGEAANAMAAIVEAVKAYGLTDLDIQTRSFNIFPQYQFEEVTRDGRRIRQQILVGYMVSNSARIKVRDLDDIGPIVDDVAEAGGNATRINGISFTVEDPKPFMEQLREAAVLEALAKAEQFASLTGVLLGGLVFISEGGTTAPKVADFGVQRAFAEAAIAAPTSISGGELELRLTVSAVFAIQ